VSSVYWVTTFVAALALLASAVSYVVGANVIAGLDRLGIPGYLRLELAALQGAAALVLLMPNVPMVVKQWAYAGATFFYLTAIIAHIAHKDPPLFTMINVALIGVLLVSDYSLHRRVGG
jgi:hypothetical protein